MSWIQDIVNPKEEKMGRVL